MSHSFENDLYFTHDIVTDMNGSKKFNILQPCLHLTLPFKPKATLEMNILLLSVPLSFAHQPSVSFVLQEHAGTPTGAALAHCIS